LFKSPIKKENTAFFYEAVYGYSTQDISPDRTVNKLQVCKTIVNNTKTCNSDGGGSALSALPVGRAQSLAPGFRRDATAIRGHTPSLASVLLWLAIIRVAGDPAMVIESLHTMEGKTNKKK
jgi:hypothetical protein